MAFSFFLNERSRDSLFNAEDPRGGWSLKPARARSPVPLAPTSQPSEQERPPKLNSGAMSATLKVCHRESRVPLVVNRDDARSRIGCGR